MEEREEEEGRRSEGRIRQPASRLNRGSNLGLEEQGTDPPTREKEQEELNGSSKLLSDVLGSEQNSCPAGTSS